MHHFHKHAEFTLFANPTLALSIEYVRQLAMSHRNISGGNFRLKNANLAETFFINTSTFIST